MNGTGARQGLLTGMAKLTGAVTISICGQRRAGTVLRACFVAMGVTFLLAASALAQAPAPPLPPPRPDRPTPPVDQDPKAPVDEGAKEDTAASEAAKACIERLTRMGLRFERRTPVRENACKIDNPVSVSGLTNGVAVSPASLMECSFAENLARWISDVVVPRASEHLQSTPIKLLIGTSYQCRDQRSGSKLSEHAFGNGVDVMGFEFDKHAPLAIKLQADGSPEAMFQSAVRKETCSVFTTVLGPGSDADHGDHFHLDMRKRKADYRICQ